ncbi:U32 family peptidase [Magnetospirillum sp. SS-4]|uniref:U32 family peptidase n=1 Tax=Magnetospirillum sp. SS-4 TaxID=2681465 RepID=UPI001384321B|nr:U32 family peptidase [Magnetospirillum sp. SS-4]CAA7612304.1 Peptidase U32 [Magnetospirillum sp. SS-4]
MKIVAPISRVEEAAPMAAAGAGEIYCGIVPADWTDRFRSAGVNRRAFGNLTRYEDLAEVVDIASGHGATVSLVMNAQHYADEQVDVLLDLAGRFAEMGGHALIVGDIGLLARLGERDLPVRLHASSLLAARNAEAAALLGRLGARRIVLPRDVTLDEIAAMAARRPDLEFEAFVLNDGCVFEEGNCHTIHLPGRLGGPICLDRYATGYSRVDGRALDDAEAKALAANDECHDRWLWYRFGCGFSQTPEGLPFGPCGLCALPDMAAAGLAAVKIAGREGPLERKLASVRMVRATLDRLEATGRADAVAAFAQGLRRRPDLCASGYMCYYREVLDRPAPPPQDRAGDDCVSAAADPTLPRAM